MRRWSPAHLDFRRGIVSWWIQSHELRMGKLRDYSAGLASLRTLGDFSNGVTRVTVFRRMRWGRESFASFSSYTQVFSRSYSLICGGSAEGAMRRKLVVLPVLYLRYVVAYIKPSSISWEIRHDMYRFVPFLFLVIRALYNCSILFLFSRKLEYTLRLRNYGIERGGNSIIVGDLVSLVYPKHLFSIVS